MADKFNKTEKMMIALLGGDHVTYKCTEHGVFMLNKTSNDGKCPRCGTKCELLKDALHLKEKFQAQLGITD